MSGPSGDPVRSRVGALAGGVSLCWTVVQVPFVHGQLIRAWEGLSSVDWAGVVEGAAVGCALTGAVGAVGVGVVGFVMKLAADWARAQKLTVSNALLFAQVNTYQSMVDELRAEEDRLRREVERVRSVVAGVTDAASAASAVNLLHAYYTLNLVRELPPGPLVRYPSVPVDELLGDLQKGKDRALSDAPPVY